MGFPGGSDGKEFACNFRDPGLIPGSGTSPGEENGYPLQYSCRENFMHRGAWSVTVHRIAELDITEQLTLPIRNLLVCNMSIILKHLYITKINCVILLIYC